VTVTKTASVDPNATSTKKDTKKHLGKVHVIPGFGPKSTHALATIGIHTVEELRGRDPYDVYRQLKESAPRTNLNFMYGLIAAVEERDWREVQRTNRTEILLRLDEMGIAPK
jgi:DNA transformation protein and related proteins